MTENWMRCCRNLKLTESLAEKRRGVGRRNMKKLRINNVGDNEKLTQGQLVTINPSFDEDYLDDLIAKAKHNWKGIDPDQWLHNLRGEYQV